MAKNHNMTRYMKNAAKSVGKVASEVVKTTMPVMSDTAINSQQTIQEFRRVVTTGRSSINRANIIQNKLFKPVQQILANAKEDLKSGNLYNTSRNSNDYGMSDLMDSLLDDEPMEDIESPVMDMSAFNKVLQSSTASSLAGYDKSTKMLAKNSTANTEYLGELQTKLNTQHMMILTQHHMQLMKKMDNLQNIGMSLMEFNTKTATDYFDKDIQMQSAQLSELQEIRKILDEQHEIMHKTMRNSNANKGPKASNLANIFNPNGSFNTSGFIQNAKNNISNKIPVSKDMLGFVFNEFKDNPVGTLLTMAMKGGIPGKTKKKFSSMDNAFSGALANLMLTLNAWNNGPTDKEWKRTLGSIFGTNKQSFNTNLGLYKNQELNADLELKKSKAITEVIPSYLSEILKSMTGIDKSFDYGKGRFVDNAKIRSDLVRDRRAAAASTASRSSDYVKKKATGFTNNLNKRERDSFVDDIETFHEWYMMTDLYKKKSVTYEEALKNGLPDLDGGGSTFRLIWQMYKSCDQSKINRDRIDYQLGMLDQIHYQTMDTIMSGRSAAINGLSDERDINILHMNKRPGAKVNRGSYNIDKYNKTQFNKVINSIDDDAFTIDFDINNYKEPGKIEKLVKKWRGDINQFVNSRFGGSKHFSKARTYANRLMNQALKQAEKANDPRFYEDIVANVQNAVANKFGGSTNVKENIRTRTANTKENVKTTASNARTTVTNAVGTVQAQVQNAASNILGDDKVSAGSVDEPPSNTGRGKLYEYAKGMLPSTVVSGAIGGVIGKLFNRSPLLGSIIGAGANILYQSSKVQEMLYGDPNKEDDHGLIGDIKNKFDKAIFEPLQKVMDPFNQLLTEKIINPMHNWLNKKADGINAWLSNKLGVETAKKSKEQVRHEETIKVLTEIKEATQGKTDEAKKVTEVITEAINPEAAKSKGKVTKVFDKALSGIKDGAVTGVSAGKGALISSLLGLGPIPGMIFGTLMGRHKVKKNHKNDTDVNTQKEADDVDEAVKTATGDKKKAGFGTRLKYETIGSAASSLLGLGPIPGFLVGRIYANHKKPKEKKKLTQEQKEAAKLQKQLDWQANGGMKGAAKRFFGKRKNEILGMAGSSLLGLGPIPGLIAARVYNKSKYKLKKGKNPDDESTNVNNIKSTTDSIKEKINKQKAARTEQALGKELIKNAMNGDLEATQEKIKNLQTNADSEEELAMIKRQSDVASNISGLSGGVGGNGTSEKKSGLFDLLKNLAGGLGSIISKLGIGGILKLLAGGLGIGVLQKGINYINDLKDHGAGGLGTENDYGDSNFANWTDNAINGMKFGQGVVANVFGSKFISGLTKHGKLSTVAGGALNSALNSGVGAFYAGQSMKYNFGQAGAYSDRYDTNSANSEKILGIHRGTQMFTKGINALGSLSVAVAPKLGDAVLNAGVGLEKVAANTKDGGVINKVASKAAELCGKVLGVKSLTAILEKAGIKNIGNSTMQRLIQTLLVKLPGNATSKLADLVPVLGQIWMIAKYVAAFIRGVNNTRKDLQVAEDFEYNSFGFAALKVINGLFYCIDEFLCGILTSFNMQSIFLELCLKLPCFSNLGDKVKESQEKAQSDYETFLQENDLNREGYTYEMYQKQSNPTTWGKIKKLFTGKKGYEDYKSGGKKNAQLKEKYGGYVSTDSVETDTEKAVNAMQEVYAEKYSDTGGISYAGDNNSTTTYDSSTTNNIILNGVATTGSGGRGIDTNNIRTVVGSAIRSLSKTSHNSNWNTYDLKHGKGVMDNFKGNSPLKKSRPANVDTIYKKIGLISGSGTRQAGRGGMYGRGTINNYGRGTAGEALVAYEKSLEGTITYVYGAADITGSRQADCSGLQYCVYKECLGIEIPRDTYSMLNTGTEVVNTRDINKINSVAKPGDLLVWDGHVEMYVSPGRCIGIGSGVGPKEKDISSPMSYHKSNCSVRRYVDDNATVLATSSSSSSNKIKLLSNNTTGSTVSTSLSSIPTLMRTRLNSSRNKFDQDINNGTVTKINNNGSVSYSDSSGNKGFFKTIGNAIKSGITNVTNGIKSGVTNGWNTLKSEVSWVKSKLFGSGARGEDSDYYNQADPRWGNNSFGRYDGHRDTIADGGCGPTVAAMALQKLTGKKITPDNMARLAMSSGMKYDDGGTDPGFFNQVGSKYGYSFNQSNVVDDNAIASLKSGKPVIFMGQDQTGTSPFGSGMHYVLGTGMDANGNVNILDPQNQYNNHTYNINDLAASTVNTISPGGKSKPIRYSSRSGRSNKQTGTSTNSSGISYIVIHYTANDGDTAAGNCNYFKTDGRKASAHYFVDTKEIRQSVPDNKRAWHCGSEDGNYYCNCRNDNSIGIEMCSIKSNGKYTIPEATQIKTANLTKYLMKKYNIPLSNVIRHYDVTHKICPEPFVRDESQWTAFKQKVQNSNGLNVNIIQDLTTVNFSNRTGSISDAANGNIEASIGGGNYVSSLMNTLSGIWSSAYTTGLFNNISAMFNGGETEAVSSSAAKGTASSASEAVNHILGSNLDGKQAYRHNIYKYTSANVTEDKLRSAVSSYAGNNRKILQYIPNIIATAEKYGVDPRWIISNAAGEAGWDLDNAEAKNHNNFFGIDGGGNNVRHFNSAQAGWDAGVAWIKENYFDPGEHSSGSATWTTGTGQQSFYAMNNPTSVGASDWHTYTPNYDDPGTKGSIYSTLINSTGGAGARGGRGTSFKKGRGVGAMTPHISPRMRSDSSIMNRSDINLVKSAMETKSRGNSVSGIQHVHTSAGKASDTSSVDTAAIVKALGMIIDLLSNIDKSNTVISNKEFSSNTVVAAPSTNVQSSIPQGTNTSKQNLLSAIVSGI